MTNKLPTKPSALIRLALSDLKKVEVDPRYSVYMSIWHAPRSPGVCHVCLAGAVLAMSLGASPTEEADPLFTPHLAEFDRSGLLALDCFRLGKIDAGLFRMGLRCPQRFKDNRYHTPYLYNELEFHATMHSLANELEEAGL